MNYQEEIDAAKGFVLTHWHTFAGGLVLGLIAGYALHWL